MANQEDIQVHYDVSNQFYSDILGPSITYSSGHWRHAETLEAAQYAKIDRLINFVVKHDNVKRFLDIGCGWGKAMDRCSEQFPQIETIDGLTLSQSQFDYYNHLSHDTRCNMKIEHYDSFLSENSSPYQGAISVEALEHFVSPADVRSGKTIEIYRRFFSLVRNNVDGNFAIQFICNMKSIRQLTSDERKKAINFMRFISKHIFPNSFLPNVSDILKAIDGIYEIENIANFAEDYSQTLQQWKQNLLLHSDKYDKELVNRYLKYFDICIEQFDNETLGDVMLLLRPVQHH